MKVAIFAGGKGSRLIEETTIRPKPLVEIGRKPLLWHIMQHYSVHGHNHFVLALGYMGDAIKRYIADLSKYQGNLRVDLSTNDVRQLEPPKWNTELPSPPWVVDLIDTGVESMTAWRLQLLRPYLDGETFMLTYGDGLSDINIGELVDYHKSHGRLATISMVNPHTTFGHLTYDKTGRVLGFNEKPCAAPNFINGGFFVLEPEVFDFVKPFSGPDVMWEQAPLRELMELGELMAYEHTGFWSCCDHLADKRRLEEMWNNGDRPWATWENQECIGNRPPRIRGNGHDPGIGRGGHPASWVRYRTV